MHGAGNICSTWFIDIRIYKLVPSQSDEDI